MAGAFLENFVVSQIWKSCLNAGIDAPLYYYRDHDAKEIDLIIEADGKLHPLEIKKTATPAEKHGKKLFCFRQIICSSWEGCPYLRF